MIWKLVLIAVISYVLGSVNFSIILSRYVAHKDIRTGGSGNAGATNMYRTHGKSAGFATMFGDIIKVLVAITIARLIIGDVVFDSFPYLIKYFSGFFCVFGHIFPVFFKFKGGKGVATCAGMILMLDWRIWLIELVIFVTLVGITKMVSVGSVVMALVYPFLTYFFYTPTTSALVTQLDIIRPYEQYILTAIALVFSIIVLVKHRANIKRIFAGNENKISFHSKKKNEKPD